MEAKRSLHSGVKKCVSQKLVVVAKKFAGMEVNWSCPLFAYQPKIPESVKTLKKF